MLSLLFSCVSGSAVSRKSVCFLYGQSGSQTQICVTVAGGCSRQIVMTGCCQCIFVVYSRVIVLVVDRARPARRPWRLKPDLDEHVPERKASRNVRKRHRRLPALSHTRAIMWPSLLAGLALLASQAQALYFYIDGPSQKCFFEELPKDTLVVGMDGLLDADTWTFAN